LGSDEVERLQQQWADLLVTMIGDLPRRRLAERMDISPSRVTNVIYREQNVTLETMARWAAALGYRVQLWYEPIGDDPPGAGEGPTAGAPPSPARPAGR
jgi:transcriptional regulator with XRE-family HTH domain